MRWFNFGNFARTRIGVEFDGKLLVVNRARLVVDGTQVDSASVVHGQKDLQATLADGTDVSIRFHP